MDMNFREIVLYTLPSLFVPLLFNVIFDYIKKTGRYRLNDTITNLSVSLANLGSTFIILTIVLMVYSYMYSHFALIRLDQKALSTWLIAFLLYDLAYYWNHRLHHTISVLWASHMVHHSGEEMNVGVSIRQSFFAELTMWPTFLLIAFFGISGEVFLVTSYIQAVWAFLIHTQCFRKTTWLDRIINMPSVHRVHHATDKLYIDKNFGGILVIWDKIFGTYQREQSGHPVHYGVRESFPSYSPISINCQYYKTIWKKISHSNSMSEILRSIFSSPNWLPQGLSKNVFYAEISNLAARRRAPSNEALATHIKVSCICRFILVISVFTFLMWNFNTLGWLQILNLSLLFFWLSHYNGIVFDGIHATWKTEFASQLIISVSSIIALYNHEPIQFLITIIFSAISLTSYALYRYQQNKSRADNLVQALAE